MKKHYLTLGFILVSGFLLLTLHNLGCERVVDYVLSFALFVLASGIYRGCVDMATEILEEYEREHRATIDLVAKVITQLIVTLIGLASLWVAAQLIAKGV